MQKEQFKQVLMQYFSGMCNKWFDTNSFQDVLCKSMANTILKANINKYDNYLEYFCDEHGNIFINDLLDNMIDNFIPWQLDLTKYHMPFLPNKILLVGKQDLIMFKNMCVQCEQG